MLEIRVSKHRMSEQMGVDSHGVRNIKGCRNIRVLEYKGAETKGVET